MLLALKMTRGSRTTPSAEIHSIIEVQVRVFIVLTGTELEFSCEEPITSPLMPWPSIMPPSSALYLCRGGIQLTVSYMLNKRLIFSGVASFMRSQLVRRPNFD